MTLLRNEKMSIHTFVRYFRRRSRSYFILGTILINITSAYAKPPSDIWFSPKYGPRTTSDFMELFEPSAAWQHAASLVSALEISNELTYNHIISEKDLQEIIHNLQQRKIDLVLGIPPIDASGRKGDCGYNVEGYGIAGGLLGEAQHLKLLGAEPKYFSMDEPLYFGYVFTKDGDRFGCKLSIQTIAAEVAKNFFRIRSVFPNARFGDVEPFMGFNKQTWLNDLSAWFDAYEAATGDKLAYFRLDIAWKDDWQDRMPALKKLLREKRIPLQVIYNGDDNVKSDEDWMESALSHLQEFEKQDGIRPDSAVIQYWGVHPSHALPETDSRTATWLIDRYATWRDLQR